MISTFREPLAIHSMINVRKSPDFNPGMDRTLLLFFYSFKICKENKIFTSRLIKSELELSICTSTMLFLLVTCNAVTKCG